MNSPLSTEIQWEQWISCGFKMFHENKSELDNLKWLGSLYSPVGSGGNFLIRGRAKHSPVKGDKRPSSHLISDLELPMKAALKYWDHKFLNDLDWEVSALTPESLIQGLVFYLSDNKRNLPDLWSWSFVQIQLGPQLIIEADFSGGTFCHYRFRLQSFIAPSRTGVDVVVDLQFDGHGWKQMPMLSQFPVGELQSWEKNDLRAVLENQTLDNWLGINQIEDIPMALFLLMKQKFSALKSVSIQQQGCEIITTSL